MIFMAGGSSPLCHYQASERVLVPDSTSSSGSITASNCFVVTVENLLFGLGERRRSNHTATMLGASVCIEKAHAHA